MEKNPICWFEIYVQDMARAKKFYETMLGVELEELNSIGIELWGFPMSSETPGCSGALARMEGVNPGGNSTLVYFSCEDCANEQNRVEAAGGKVHRAKFSIGQYGFISLVSDTEGNMVGLHSLH